jgi:hypothetical protein
MLAAVAVATACLVVPAAAGATTVVTPDAGGRLTVTGGGEVNAIALRNGGVDPFQLYIAAEAPTDFPDPDGLQLAGSGLGCVDGSPVLIVCDSTAVTGIDLNLGAGRDLVDASGLSHLGGAITADLGAGDDVFTGGPLPEQVRDGRGTDVVSADTIVQADVSDPASMDAGDVLDGTVSYASRHHDTGVAVTLDDTADDGAPGEHDRVRGSVSGTPYADVLTGSAGADTIDGRGGDDVIDGGAGDDTLLGGTGGDTITGGDGNDSVTADPAGTTGDDIVHVEDAQADGAVTCGRGSDAVSADLEEIDGQVEPLHSSVPDVGCESVTRLIVDRTAPVLTLTQTPPASTESTTALFGWNTDDATATETCTLDGTAATCVNYTARLTGLSPGTHTFAVRAQDPAGNVGGTSYTWTITTPAAGAEPAPVATPTSTPATPVITRPAPVLAAPKFVRPAGGRLRLEARNRLTLRFTCASVCSGQALQVRAGRYRLPVTVSASAGSAKVRVTVPKRLATAIRRAGKRGMRAALTTAKGTPVATLRMYR